MTASVKNRSVLPCFELDVDIRIQYLGTSKWITFSACDNGESLLRLRRHIDEVFATAHERLADEQ